MLRLSFLLIILCGKISFAQKKDASKNRSIQLVASLNRESEKIQKTKLLYTQGVLCDAPKNKGIHITCNVQSFSLLLVRENNSYYKESSENCFFSEEFKEKIKTVKNGDLLIIYNIVVKSPLGIQQVPSIVYQIYE